MEYPIKVVILTVLVLAIFLISAMFIINLGHGGEGILDAFYKWLIKASNL